VLAYVDFTGVNGGGLSTITVTDAAVTSAAPEQETFVLVAFGLLWVALKKSERKR
jgi:hypothetical protein